MNQAVQLAENSYPIRQSNRDLTIVAQVVTLLISTLPEIIWIELSGSSPVWLTYAKMSLLLVLTLMTFVWQLVRPLCNFFRVMFAFFGLMELRLQFNFTLPALQALFSNTVFDARMQTEQTGKLAVTLLMIAALLILGYKRRNFFLTRGNLRTPMLATLEPVCGSNQGLWQSAYFFGIAHYFGTPGGLIGGMLSIFMGWILGKGMVETRGLFWTWWIHFLSDIAIFTFLTAALLR